MTDEIQPAPPSAPSDKAQVAVVHLSHDDGAITAKVDASVLAEPVDPKQARKAKLSDMFTVLASGAALISDGYQNNVLTLVNVLFAKRYGSNVYNSDISTRVSNALLVGAVLGQVTVGIICDRVGRKSAILITTTLLVIGAIFATAATAVHGSTNALFWWLTVSRGVVGFGVGGEYPASSVSASEASNERYGQKSRSSVFIAVTNVVLSLGGPFAVSVFLIVLSATGYSNTTQAWDLKRLDITWRVCFGFGALLPLSVFWFRWRMLNSKLYRANAIRQNVPYWLALKKYWPRLVGTTVVWFLYDFVTFPNGVFSGTIISTIIPGATLKQTAEYQLLLSSIALPGALLGPFLIRWLGSKYQLMLGFAGYLVVGLIIGLSWNHLITVPGAFVFMYGMLASMGNAGPGSVCGLIASDSYPTALRGSFYGFSAAIGKVGAAVGTQAFLPIQKNLGKPATFYFSAGIGVLGILIAWFFVVDTAKLDLAMEDEEWRQYLLANGWNGYMGDGTVPEHNASDFVPSLAASSKATREEMCDLEDAEQAQDAEGVQGK
ncbi:MFS general substrate transporter [Tilletiaria anomala UBC 951]|uniref:MFS general substrate transporter n=1 Tax=Tilletiaria anomala (strain ATCC 24038 / CBS 436.72 / UBC 951) TaxID=1037660 RepID=A0A066VNM9_TILAU|nr:MFS general substrate transporter [Tilletiaria anomala UBC 951]KDN40344.1 MFS general substrate transporter [Tilletiaria anomala UBC 951]